MADWEVVGSESTEGLSAVEWLNAKGLEKYAEKIVELTEAESLKDFKLLDVAGPTGESSDQNQGAQNNNKNMNGDNNDVNKDNVDPRRPWWSRSLPLPA